MLIDLTSTQFSYTPLTINGADGTYMLLDNCPRRVFADRHSKTEILQLFGG